MKEELKTLIRLFLLFTFCFHLSKAQGQVVASAKVDTGKVVVGQTFMLELTLSQNKNQKIQWPYISDSIGKLEVIQAGKIDTMPVEDPSILLRRQVVVLMAFDTGNYIIPSFSFKNDKENNDQLVETDPLKISVFLIPVDTTKAIRDIHAIATVPFDWMLVLEIIVLIIVLAVIVYFIVRYLKKKKKNDELNEIVYEKKLPAHEIALEALLVLKEKELWQSGQIKKYYTELTDILRIYIQDRWNINAMELTSDEILSSGFIKLISNDQIEDLKFVLVLSDLVKFAKAQPFPHDHESSMLKSIQFVERTAQLEIANNKIDNKEVKE